MAVLNTSRTPGYAVCHGVYCHGMVDKIAEKIA